MKHVPFSQVALIVLDGWGHREDSTHNAVHAANTPVVDGLWQKYPHTLLAASGLAVGLPEGQMGNSEIGHTTIGAGKAIDTDLVRINKAIDDGSFAKNSAITAIFSHVVEHGSTLHLLGLTSAGGVHSHHHHLFAVLRAAKEAGVTRVAIHAFTDGRDTAPTSAAAYLRELELVLAEVGIGRIATLSGRYYAMDRDKNWDRLAKVEDALYRGVGTVHSDLPSELMQRLYTEKKMDEHIEPVVFLDDQGKATTFEQHDACFVFNFRSDRARMLTVKLQEKAKELDLLVGTLTQYEPTYDVLVAFPPFSIETTLAAEVAAAGLTQAHLAETEKFPHATYFLNGGKEEPHTGERHIMLESRKDVATHDLAPEMRAEAIADKAIEQIEDGVNFIFINFANPDMVGHTANVPAIITALETVDTQLGRVLTALRKTGGVALVTADHGNAEVNVDPETGEGHTAHTLNPVPCFLVAEQQLQLVQEGRTLADLAPTALSLLGIPVPVVMTGQSLLEG
jgi:2,3-bisphosphoglycerate-independent phosphoglycerate mutase